MSNGYSHLSRDPDAKIPGIVADDLRALLELPELISSTDIRQRLGPMLRRLLVNDDFGRAWRMLGLHKSPRIPASDLLAQARNVPRDRIVFAFAQPYKGIRIPRARVSTTFPRPAQPGRYYLFPGYPVGHGPYLLHDPFESGATPQAPFSYEITSRPLGPPEQSDFTLTRFLESPSLIVGGDDIPRRTVIKYMSETRGGVHSGKRRRKSQDEKLYKLLDVQILRIAPRTPEGNDPVQPLTDALFIELVSIAGFLGASRSAYEYLKAYEASRS